MSGRFKSLRLVVPWLALSACIAILDQGSKLWIESLLHRGERLEVTGFFNLVLVYNPGAAFSFLADGAAWQRPALIAIAVIAIVVIATLLVRESGHLLFRLALALILGGAMGNLWDRVFVGAVIDFLDFHVAGWHWPAFNVADSAICVGAALLIADSFRRTEK